MLTGSTLPLLPLLDGLVRKHSASLTRRDQTVAAMRVQMEERRLVGVRFPKVLMTHLNAGRAHTHPAPTLTHTHTHTYHRCS